MKQFEYFDLHHTAEGIAYHGKFWPSRYKNAIQNLLGSEGWELVCASRLSVEKRMEIVYTYKREQLNDFVMISSEESDLLNHISQQKEKQHHAQKVNTLYKTFEDWAKRTGFLPNADVNSKRIDQWIKKSQLSIMTLQTAGPHTTTQRLLEQHLKLTYSPETIRLSVSYLEDGIKVHTITEEFGVDQAELLKGFEVKSSEEVHCYEALSCAER